MALTPEEKSQLEALQAKENEPEQDDDEYIEIWDDTGAGAKVKRSAAKSWLNKFGIDLEEVAPEAEEKPEKKSVKRPTSDGNVTHAAKYFGSKNAG
jgi:hypothetical protein